MIDIIGQKIVDTIPNQDFLSNSKASIKKLINTAPNM